MFPSSNIIVEGAVLFNLHRHLYVGIVEKWLSLHFALSAKFMTNSLHAITVNIVKLQIQSIDNSYAGYKSEISYVQSSNEINIKVLYQWIQYTSLLLANFSHAVTHNSIVSTRISSGMSECCAEQTETLRDKAALFERDYYCNLYWADCTHHIVIPSVSFDAISFNSDD
jgi:hypothetical protein